MLAFMTPVVLGLPLSVNDPTMPRGSTRRRPLLAACLLVLVCALADGLPTTLHEERFVKQFKYYGSKPLHAGEFTTRKTEELVGEILQMRHLLRQTYRIVESETKAKDETVAVEVGTDGGQKEAQLQSRLDDEARRRNQKPHCSEFLECKSCRAVGCAWCLGERVCVPDEAWYCQGDVDHVGVIGKVKVCPTAEDRMRKVEEMEREAAAASIAAGAAARTVPEPVSLTGMHCVGWRQTSDCSSSGARQPTRDLPCHTAVQNGSSGYCECEGTDENDGKIKTVKLAESTCEHDVFTCAQVCLEQPTKVREAARRAREELHKKSKEELERIRKQAPETERQEEDATRSGESVEEKRARIADIRKRAKQAEAADGSTRPYEVLEISETATQRDIRKAYRRLSVRFHPDKNQDVAVEAAVVFGDLVAAFEVLNDPEKRDAFDDWGGGEGFQTQYEYEKYGNKRKSRGFFSGFQYISDLNSVNWHKRLFGNSIWLVNLYAPWCTHCQKSVGFVKQLAETLKDDIVSVGAVNCEKEAKMCRDSFNVRAYPTYRLINQKFGTQQEYSGPHDVASMRVWALDIAKEWSWLFNYADLVTITSHPGETFADVVAPSLDFWIILFLDGEDCGPCRTAKTNILRLSARLRGLARTGIVNCGNRAMRGLCESLDLPQLPHSPQVRAFRSGVKGAEDVGEVLYNPNDVEPHNAMKLVEKVVRLSHADKVAADALAGGNTPGDFEEDKKDEPEPPPPQPEPRWEGPKGRGKLNIGGGASHHQARIR